MWFSVKFDRSLTFQGFDGIFGVRVMIFDVAKSGENVDFSGFARSGYRSDFGVFGDFKFLSRCMDRTDSPVFDAEHLFWNVNYPPLWTKKIYYNSTVL